MERKLNEIDKTAQLRDFRVMEIFARKCLKNKEDLSGKKLLELRSCFACNLHTSTKSCNFIIFLMNILTKSKMTA